MASEALLALVTDNAQHSQQCPVRGEFQTGSSIEKGTTEEPVNEASKTGNSVSEEDGIKNHGWKGFSLKRQLSKVDLKIKSTFTPTLVTSQNGVLVCFLISFKYIFYYFHRFLVAGSISYTS